MRTSKGELTAETQRDSIFLESEHDALDTTVLCASAVNSPFPRRGNSFLESEHDALDTITQQWDVKVDEQTHLPSAKLEIAEQLSLVDGKQDFNSFYLYDDQVGNKKIEPIAAVQPHAFVIDP